MFAIGFLSLLSLGFVAMSMGDEDDVSDVDQGADSPDDQPLSGQNGDLFDPTGNAGTDLAALGIDVPENVAEEDLVRINAFLSELETMPSHEITASIQEFFEELTTESAQGDDDQADESFEDVQEIATDGDVDSDGNDNRPPMGDEFRDPLKEAGALEVQDVEDEIGIEDEIDTEDEIIVGEERPPENLVTVSDGDGVEVDDDLVLAAREENAPTTDPTFTVTAPEAANSIDVGYDAEHTFKIEYNGQTSSVTAGLNSDIEGEEIPSTRSITNEDDETGANVRTISWTKEYGTSTDIILEVAQDDIGTHVSQIDLTNPNDELNFEFDVDVTGNLHLVYLENEEGTEVDTSTVKRAFVIQTPEDVSSLSANEIASLIDSESGQTDDGTVLAEIYLGEDSLFIKGDPGSGEAYEVRITNFINEEPSITSSIGWSSITEHDDAEL